MNVAALRFSTKFYFVCGYMCFGKINFFRLMCKDGESLYPNNSSPSTILQLYHNRENGNKCFYSRKSIKESDITISSELLL